MNKNNLRIKIYIKLMETTKKVITRNRPSGLVYNCKLKDLTIEDRKLIRKEQNKQYYLKRKEMIENYKKILKE